MRQGPGTPYAHQVRDDGGGWAVDSFTDFFPLAVFLALIMMALAAIWYASRRL
ncbi:hypothetical protein [Nesterenkonia muleiensis]|uniref:hypothetical protein n=1 Tax=Nesterenkonia muleiensis TaxID=2282648 RepID=UPI001300BC20|nr:hypothetical protein [Nesterenkonia muleiensis]